MTSPTENKQHQAPRRRRRPAMIIILVSLALIGGGWHLWDRYGTHNIFDAIMNAEWAVADVHGSNPALSDKYRGALARGTAAPYGKFRQQLGYWSHTGAVSITIEPDHDKTDCSELGCKTTYWKEKTPTALRISLTERITDEDLWAFRLVYDRHSHSFHEQVVVRRNGELLNEDEAAAVLAEHGITGDHLRQKRDWLLYEKVLPDFLAANPQVHYTARNWGWVKVTEDRFLTP